MLLVEFADNDPLKVKLVGVVSQLKARMRDVGSTKPFNTDALVALLNDNDINVTKADLFDMIKQLPLKNIIKNIRGDEVIFVGQKTDDKEKSPEDSEKEIKKMAKRAAKK